MKKDHVVSIELKLGNGRSKLIEGKIIEHSTLSASVIVSNAIKLEFEYPSGKQIASGVKDEVRGFCSVKSWREKSNEPGV